MHALDLFAYSQQFMCQYVVRNAAAGDHGRNPAARAVIPVLEKIPERSDIEKINMANEPEK